MSLCSDTGILMRGAALLRPCWRHRMMPMRRLRMELDTMLDITTKAARVKGEFQGDADFEHFPFV